MSWGGANRPTTSSRVENRPGNREGADGDIQIKGTGLGAKLFAKWSGRWWDVPLSIDGVTKFGVTDSDYLSIDRESVDIYTNSVKVASFGSDISLAGKITLTSTATDNICIGKWSSGDPDVGEGNVVIGVDAGNALNSITDDVVLIGKDAGKAITAADATANYAVAIGPSALATIVAPLQCTAIGYQAMYRGAKSVYNVAVGYRALYGKDTSFWSKYNVAVGTGAMGDADGDTDSVNGAEYNTAIGHHAMKGLIAGNKNVGIGHGALLRVEGNNNVAVGETAGEYITVGNDNICIGKDAGDNITTGSDNVVIGGADVHSATGSDQLSISSGDGGVTWINGNSSGYVGIGDTTPDYQLSVGLSSKWGVQTSAGATTTKYLTIVDQEDPVIVCSWDSANNSRNGIFFEMLGTDDSSGGDIKYIRCLYALEGDDYDPQNLDNLNNLASAGGAGLAEGATGGGLLFVEGYGSNLVDYDDIDTTDFDITAVIARGGGSGNECTATFNFSDWGRMTGRIIWVHKGDDAATITVTPA